MKVSKLTFQSIVIMFFMLLPQINLPAMGGTIYSDDFSDGIQDQMIWEYSGRPGLYALESNGRLEIHADGTEDDTANPILKVTIPVGTPFRAKIDFDSSECSRESFLGIDISNAATDLDTYWHLRFKEGMGIGNGVLGSMGLDRSWLAFKSIVDGEFLSFESEPTSVTSGTLYVEHVGDKFHFSFTGWGQENAFQTFTTEQWTSCSEVVFNLMGMSSNEPLTGQGAYFDNFYFTTTGSTTETPTYESTTGILSIPTVMVNGQNLYQVELEAPYNIRSVSPK